MSKWDKLNKEFDDALESMTQEDWNKLKNRNNMTPEQFIYWLQGFMEVAQPNTLNSTQIKIINDHLNLVLDKKTPDRTWQQPLHQDKPPLFPSLDNKDNIICCTPDDFSKKYCSSQLEDINKISLPDSLNSKKRVGNKLKC